MLAACLFCACSSTAAPQQSAAKTSEAGEKMPAAGPEAKIHISYSRPGDFLTSLVVTEYSSADNILSGAEKDASASIIRFGGGVVVWQIRLERGFLADMPVLGKHAAPAAVTEVKYGLMPPHFEVVTPEMGPPEPLQPDHYYVFMATRASGAASYEAVKVNGDGTLEAYAADPRAGTSFRLCCNIAPDFVVNANAVAPPGNEP
jgi:hypothetical protein